MTNTEETLAGGEEVEALNRQPSPQIVITRGADIPAAMEDGTRSHPIADKADAALSQFHERAISEVSLDRETQRDNDVEHFVTT